MNQDQMASKMVKEGVDLDLSVGAFHGSTLVGFILHAKRSENGRITLYNAGTGVIPNYRGRRLTRRMYTWLMPRIREEGVELLLLEAIDKNIPAIRSYESIGFAKSRLLKCYRGTPKGEKHNEVREVSLKDVDLPAMSEWWDWKPSFQNSTRSILNGEDDKALLITNQQSTLAGYLIYTENGRIHQFAVAEHYRKQGLATKLFEYAASITGTVSTINVDGDAQDTICFLEGLGLINDIDQIEMTMPLD